MALLPLGLSKILGITVHLVSPRRSRCCLMVFAAVLGGIGLLLGAGGARRSSAIARDLVATAASRMLRCCWFSARNPATRSHSPFRAANEVTLAVVQARRRGPHECRDQARSHHQARHPGRIIAARGPKSSASIPISERPRRGAEEHRHVEGHDPAPVLGIPCASAGRSWRRSSSSAPQPRRPQVPRRTSNSGHQSSRSLRHWPRRPPPRPVSDPCARGGLR